MTVACDVSAPGSNRYIYVKVDEIQRSQIEALECLELDRATLRYMQKASNVHKGECKLRLPSKTRGLTGCKVTLVIRPGAYRHSRGKISVDLFATQVHVVHRPW